MILDQFVMLGKTVPESNSDGRQFVCTAGFDLELHQAIRIYPMARRDCPKRWSISRIPIERNAKDSRVESWKIRGDRRAGYHNQINSVIDPVAPIADADVQREIVRTMSIKSLRQANAERRSLCVLLPQNIPRLIFEQGEQIPLAPTPDLFGNCPELTVAQRFQWHPRLQFTDEEQCKHDLMLREWGCYELMRKRGDNYSLYRMEEALNLETAPPLLCGNLNQHRNAWLVIAVFHGVTHARPFISEQEWQPKLGLIFS